MTRSLASRGLAALALGIGAAAVCSAQLPNLPLPRPKLPPIHLPPLPLPSLPKPSVSTLPGFSSPFRTGRVLVENNYGADVTIALYHPAKPNDVFRTYTLQGSARSYLDAADMIAGEDWGIQIVFGNGVKSAVRKLADVSSHNGTFAVTATTIMK